MTGAPIAGCGSVCPGSAGGGESAAPGCGRLGLGYGAGGERKIDPGPNFERKKTPRTIRGAQNRVKGFIKPGSLFVVAGQILGFALRSVFSLPVAWPGGFAAGSLDRRLAAMNAGRENGIGSALVLLFSKTCSLVPDPAHDVVRQPGDEPEQFMACVMLRW